MLETLVAKEPGAPCGPEVHSKTFSPLFSLNFRS